MRQVAEKELIVPPLLNELGLQNRSLRGQRHHNIGVWRGTIASRSINLVHSFAVELLVGEKGVGVVETDVTVCAVTRLGDRRCGAGDVDDAGCWRVNAESLVGRGNLRRCQLNFLGLWRVGENWR
jgi:hypothetical protein